MVDLYSGKHTKNDGKSAFLMGKSTISMAMFNSYVCLPEGMYIYIYTQVILEKIKDEHVKQILAKVGMVSKTIYIYIFYLILSGSG